MHSNIYEITVEPVHIDDWATESNFYDDDNVDYVDQLDNEGRAEAIGNFCNNPDFAKFFTCGEEPDTIVYNGKAGDVRNEWYNNIQNKLNEMRQNGNFNTYQLQKAVDSTFFGDMLFCLPGYSGLKSCPSRELMELLAGLKTGTVLHINSVFNYHW